MVSAVTVQDLKDSGVTDDDWFQSPDVRPGTDQSEDANPERYDISDEVDQVIYVTRRKKTVVRYPRDLFEDEPGDCEEAE